MTNMKKAFAVGALTLVAFGAAAAPALADSHTPTPPHTAFVLDNHLPVSPPDSHTPLIPLDSHTP
ncbi:hypothetical protein ACIQU1_25540 [Streptomyces angustmyceticus]|uniref:hypothetical protein n=1 Tax=Streptomyces angustmyceticus TaxID=285578 RepID=UPI00344D8388